jgi:hypothetical protein
LQRKTWTSWVGVLLVASALVVMKPMGAVGQYALRDPCAQVDESIRARFEPGARVEILLAAGNTIPHDPRVDFRAAYREIALTVLSCMAVGSHVELLPITDSSYDATPVFTGALATPPPGNTSRLWPVNERIKLLNAATPVVDQVLGSRDDYPGFDPIGALYAAGESLHRTRAGSSKLIAIVIGNGWPQTRRLNLFDYAKRKPADRIAEVLRILKRDRVQPNLKNTDVILVGTAKGLPWMHMGPSEMRSLCDFWDAVIRDSGGVKVLHDCPPMLPNLVLPNPSSPIQR